jgi:hypothetical protein
MSDLTPDGEPGDPVPPTPPLDAAVQSSAPAELRAPRGWQNWRAQRAGRPANGSLEYACHSDAPLTGLELDAGPYRLHNTLASAVARRPGQATRALILRADLHLDDTDALRHHQRSRCPTGQTPTR